MSIGVCDLEEVEEEYTRYLRSDTITGVQLGNFYIDFLNMYIIFSDPLGRVRVVPLKLAFA